MKKTSLFAILCLALQSFEGPSAQAEMIEIQPPSVATSTSESTICGPFDPECKRRLARILSAIQLLPIEVSSGARFGELGAQAAIRFSTQVAGLDSTAGDLEALLFDIVSVPEQGGVRVRFSLAQSEVMFFCTDTSGNTHAPLSGLFGSCRPDESWGISGQAAQIQWDSQTGAIAARWAEVSAVLNLLQNGNSLDYLQNRLNAFAGASADTIWVGNNSPDAGSSRSFIRGKFGISGMIRSSNNHWEIRGLASYRPNLTQWDDFSFETRTQVLYHLLLAPSVMANVGVDSQYVYSSVPENAISLWTSGNELHNAYLGALFGVVWQ